MNAKKRTTRKKKKRQFIERDMNLKTGTCTIKLPNGEVVAMTMHGLPSNVFTRLAMIGACHLVAKRKDPAKAWSQIRRGEFGRGKPKTYPLIVQAIAVTQDITQEHAAEWWNSRSTKEKTDLRRDKALQSVVYQIKAEQLADQISEIPKLIQE